MTEVCKFEFPEGLGREAIESQLALAIVVSECVFGEPRVKISAAYLFSKDGRQVVIDVSTEVGEHIARVFAGLMERKIGDMFSVDRLAEAI